MGQIFESVGTGILSSAIFSLLLIYVLQRIRYWYCLKRFFHKVIFKTYWKEDKDEIVQVVYTRVKANKIYFRGWRYANDKECFEGEFIINPINLKYGEGFHIHKDKDSTHDGQSEKFGFDKIIIKDKNTIYIDAPFTKCKRVEDENNKNKVEKVVGEQRHQAFVWRKF